MNSTTFQKEHTPLVCHSHSLSRKKRTKNRNYFKYGAVQWRRRRYEQKVVPKCGSNVRISFHDPGFVCQNCSSLCFAHTSLSNFSAFIERIESSSLTLTLMRSSSDRTYMYSKSSLRWWSQHIKNLKWRKLSGRVKFFPLFRIVNFVTSFRFKSKKNSYTLSSYSSFRFNQK